MDVPLGYVPKTKTYNVIPLWSGLGLFIQMCILWHSCPSCSQASQVSALLVESSCISQWSLQQGCQLCQHSWNSWYCSWSHLAAFRPHRRWLIWVMGKQTQQISGFQWQLCLFSEVCCTAELALKINYTAAFLKETLTMCLETTVAHSVNLQCLCIRSIINDK